MKHLKQIGKMGIFFVACAVVFGFFGESIFAAEPDSDSSCRAKPFEGVCKEPGKECTPDAGYKKYGHCDTSDTPCCVPDENIPKSGSTPITTKNECDATKGSDGKNAYCITTVGQNCSTFSLDQIGTCGSGTACCASKGTPVPGGGTSSTPSSSGSTAALNYTPLENLPGFEGQSGDFATYFKNLYLLALWIVGISALFMLVVGGFLYLSSAGNTHLLGTAKKTIYAALIGLIIALISWLLLDTINSDLTNLKLSGLSGAVGTSGNGTSTSTTPPSGNADPEGCKKLKNLSVNDAQCNLASKELVTLMTCMEGKGVSNKWTSISANAVGGDQNKAVACCGAGKGHTASCPHSDVTCHHGCTFGTTGLSYAVDIGGTSGASDATLCAIANAAKSCGGGNVWGPRTLSCGIKQESGHNDHLHVSVSGCTH